MSWQVLNNNQTLSRNITSKPSTESQVYGDLLRNIEWLCYCTLNYLEKKTNSHILLMCTWKSQL